LKTIIFPILIQLPLSLHTVPIQQLHGCVMLTFPTVENLPFYLGVLLLHSVTNRVENLLNLLQNTIYVCDFLHNIHNTVW